jgi:hypothetical protein
MFLRIKKTAISKYAGHDRVKYSLSLVENKRENGKVKQNTVKYLTSFVSEYYYFYYRETNYQERDKAENRVYKWLNIYMDLKKIVIEAQDRKDILNKINSVLPFPDTSDLEKVIAGEWARSNCFGNKYTEQTKKYVGELEGLFKEMCSGYQRNFCHTDGHYIQT